MDAGRQEEGPPPEHLMEQLMEAGMVGAEGERGGEDDEPPPPYRQPPPQRRDSPPRRPEAAAILARDAIRRRE